MEAILFILLAGVWGAFVLPSVLSDRRTSTGDAVLRGPLAQIEEPPTPQPAQVSGGATVTAIRQTSTSPTAREKVLARRKAALMGLGVAAVASLVAAVVTGSSALLVVTLLVDLALALYISMLLQIKQRQHPAARRSAGQASEEVRAVTG